MKRVDALPCSRVLAAAGIVLAFSGCDDVVRVRNLAPEVSLVAVCPDEDGARVWLDVADPEQDAVDVAVSYGAKPLRVGAVDDGVVGLSAERAAPGRRHVFRWAAASGPTASLCPTLDEPTRDEACADASDVEVGERAVFAVEARDAAGVESLQQRPEVIVGEGCEGLDGPQP